MNFSAEKALAHRVVFIGGDEEILRRRALDDLLRESGADADEFDLQTIDGDSGSPVDWYGSVSTSPFLSPRRTLVVRHLLRCEIDRLKEVDLKGLPASSLLILVADEETGDESRMQRLKTQRKHWEKAVADAGGFVVSFEVNQKQLSESIKQEVHRLGKTITEPAVQALSEMTGSSMSRTVEELEKIAIYIGSEPRIGEADVRALVVPSREWNVFRLVDAALSGEVPEALKQLRILVVSPSKADESAHRSILPQLSRTLRLVWQARLCVEATATPENIPPEILAQFPDKPNLAKEKPFLQAKAMRMARQVTLPQLERALSVLSDADARLKGMLDGFSAMETLERMMLELATIVRHQALR
jgi:DNA polymerase III subunit delta